jgi:hypothetical protein
MNRRFKLPGPSPAGNHVVESSLIPIATGKGLGENYLKI